MKLLVILFLIKLYARCSIFGLTNHFSKCICAVIFRICVSYGENIEVFFVFSFGNFQSCLHSTNFKDIKCQAFRKAGKWLPLLEVLNLSFRRCVIAELFCEGSPLFDLAQLLAYKNGDYSPEVKLSKIDNNIKVRVLNFYTDIRISIEALENATRRISFNSFVFVFIRCS